MAPRAPREDRRLTEEQKRRIRQLRSVGYLAGSQSAPAQSGITVYDKSRACDGLNLVVSGHAPKAILMDMSGAKLHAWTCGVFRAWPDFDPTSYYGSNEEALHTYWRRAHVLPNGDLFAMFEGIGLLKLDRDSNVIWRLQNGAHHDLYVAGDGQIYVLTRRAHINPSYNAKSPILEDFVTILDANGREVRTFSVLDSLKRSVYASVLQRLRPAGDILHTNTIELMEHAGRRALQAFAGGTLLLSIRYLDLVCAVDLEKETVVWAKSGLWRRQHQPTLLANGNILVLNNMAGDRISSVFEFDPVSGEERWLYRGDKEHPFYTPTCGSCQRLPNGNTLITESDSGRAFEVTPTKEIVWEYVNPHRAGRDGELIATLFEVVRVEPDFGADWLP